MTEKITSKDGTTLAVDTIGQGAPVVLVGGAFNDRSTVAALGAELASAFTVVTYDRRCRGASDDRSEDYLVANEVDDLAAVIEHAGGRAPLIADHHADLLRRRPWRASRCAPGPPLPRVKAVRSLSGGWLRFLTDLDCGGTITF